MWFSFPRSTAFAKLRLAFCFILSILMIGCRLAGDAWIVDSSACGGPQLLRRHPKGQQLGWGHSMSNYRLLSAARTHQGIRWIQKFLHTTPWDIKHRRHYPFACVSSLGTGSELHLGFTVCRSEPSFAPEFDQIQSLFCIAWCYQQSFFRRTNSLAAANNCSVR